MKALPGDAVVHFYNPKPYVALVGNPNSGKTALFNLLTGSRQKVANYAGVTVERKEGTLALGDGRMLRVLDLPGIYSLVPRSPDERVTHDVLAGCAAGERQPDLVVCVVDATNLRRTLRLVLSVRRLGLPCVVALNKTDAAQRSGIHVDADLLSRELGLPVVSTIAVHSHGDAALRELLAHSDALTRRQAAPTIAAPIVSNTLGDHQTVQAILGRLGLQDLVANTVSDRIDRVVLHPVWGYLLLVVTLFLMFQAVFAWATVPMEMIKQGVQWLGGAVSGLLPDTWLRSLLVDGIIAGVGGVLVFLPQILILFFFILILEESGYLPRAAFLLDRMMGSVGLSGRSFIPLLSSFACAIPGIMAARTIPSERDRLVTILLAPMMTCSARIPVYALLIGAFVPQRQVAGLFQLQGLVLFLLYLAGIGGAMAVAWILKRFTRSGRHARPLMMELPAYNWPSVRGIALGLWQRVEIFVHRVGGNILMLTILLWFLASFPMASAGAGAPAIESSYAGMIGHALSKLFAPLGFNWQISVALVPGMAAREVVVSSLATVYALSASGADSASTLMPLIADQWSLATGLSLLAWFVFAPQCLSTLAAIKRETGGWTMPAVVLGYLFALAYLASFIVYQVAVALGA